MSALTAVLIWLAAFATAYATIAFVADMNSDFMVAALLAIAFLVLVLTIEWVRYARAQRKQGAPE